VQVANQACLNLLHWKVTGIVGIPEMDISANDIYDNLKVIYQSLMSNDAKVLGVILKRLSPLITAGFLSTNAAVSGTIVSAAAPNQACGVITKQTGLPGRAKRGRLYIGGLPSTLVGASVTIDPVLVADMQAAGNLLSVPLTVTSGMAASAEFTPVVLHRGPPITTTDITAMKARAYIATQYRRGGTGRPNVPPF
jgi:hypothetical protein